MVDTLAALVNAPWAISKRVMPGVVLGHAIEPDTSMIGSIRMSVRSTCHCSAAASRSSRSSGVISVSFAAGWPAISGPPLPSGLRKPARARSRRTSVLAKAARAFSAIFTWSEVSWGLVIQG